MKEFFFLYKEFGFGDALFYFFYKIELKISLTSFFKEKKIRRANRIEKVYTALSLLKSKSVSIGSKKYFKKQIPGFPECNIYVRAHSSDLHVFQQVLVNEEYKSVIEIYRQLFFQAPVRIIDCGANIGLFSVYISRFYPLANFTAIEPFKENMDLVKMNFESCGLTNFSLLEGGVWNHDTLLSIDRQFRDGKEWSISLNETDNGFKQIKGYSILTLVEKNGHVIDILKIDIEGAEKILFQDSVYANSFLKQIKCLVIEIHDEFNIRAEIYEVLRECNFFYYNSMEFTVCINRNFIV